ncbi:hypothetical protein ACWEQW_05745 [Streptomyces nigra]
MSQATYVRTADVALGDLRPFPGNARRGDPAVILQSLVRNGQFRSLIGRETADALVVLASNHTLQALLAHGPGPCGMTTTVDGQELPCALCGGQNWEPTARCEIVTCDDTTATRINIVDNKAAQTGGWDQEALAELIAGLDGDLDGTVYTDADLADLVAAIEEAYEDEEEPEEPAEAAPAATAPPPRRPAGPVGHLERRARQRRHHPGGARTGHRGTSPAGRHQFHAVDVPGRRPRRGRPPGRRRPRRLQGRGRQRDRAPRAAHPRRRPGLPPTPTTAPSPSRPCSALQGPRSH